ncbi:MAG: galactosyltransferase-related protein, partial [Blastocatellia bacterium]
MSDHSDSGFTRSDIDLVLIVPYRDRLEHLRIFVPYMERFLRRFRFHIVVVEQSNDDKPFNKGRLLNIGYALAGDRADCICFHDVDMLPFDNACDYSPPSHTTHLAGRAEQFGYQLPYPEYFGGVLLTSRSDFEKANGFSNDYWGWGCEDDDLFVRFVMAGVRIDRRPGLYKCLPHGREQCSAENTEHLMYTLVQASRDSNDPAIIGRIRQVMNSLGNQAASMPRRGGQSAFQKAYSAD